MVLILSGPVLVAREYFPRLALPNVRAVPAVAILLPLVAIQLLQGGARPYQGWAAIALILTRIIAGFSLSASSGDFDPLAGVQPFLTFLVLFILAPVAGFILLGLSMRRTGHFSRPWGYAVAVVGSLTLLTGFAFLGILFFILGLRELLSLGSRDDSPPTLNP
jgi:hypothetical protein